MKRKIISCFVALLMVVGLITASSYASAETWEQYLQNRWDECETKFSSLDKTTGLNKWGGGSVQPAEGDGTTDNPYKVYTADEFRYAMENKKSLILMKDIDLGRQPWAPITVSASENMTFDGKDHTIYNLYVTGAGSTSATGAGVGLFAYVDNPNFHMNNIKFRFAEVRTTIPNNTNYYNYAVAIAYLKRGHLDNVGIEDSLVYGNRFAAGLLTGWDSGYNAVDISGNRTNAEGTTINHCHTTRVYTYGASCIGNFAAPLRGCYITNSYAVDGVTVSTAGHSGGFVSCPGYNYVENCFCNITMYGYNQTAVFSGVSHYTNKYVNCFASGVVEGVREVGGFVGQGYDSSTQPSYYENCYSTTMVGMQSNAQNMGGFVGYDTSLLHFKNCYAAGEVGTLTTDPKTATNVGGFAGVISAGTTNCTNCFYDKQTTAMAERVVGGRDTYTGVTGYQTKEILGTKQEDGSVSLPAGYTDDTWLAHEGMYPQLNVFSDDRELAKNFLEEDRDIVKAYSAASVCTALLYPSNSADYTDENYDTVRSIRYLFPFTNDELVSDNSFEVSWEADDLKCQIEGMTNLPIISLKSDTYAVKSLAPGVGWVTVKVKYYPNPKDKSKYTVGTRRLRLVPTTTLSVATAAGVDSTIWVIPEGAKPLEDEYRKYDHRDDVNFCLGDALQLSSGKIQKEAYPKTEEGEAFSNVALNTVGGFVNVIIEKKNKDKWEEITLTEEKKELFLGKRNAEEKDLGEYRFSYRWYASGQEGGAHLESSKQLTVLKTYKVTYDMNDKTNKEMVDLGAYKTGDTVYEMPEEPKRIGYTFKGWNTKADGKGKSFDETSEITEDIKVYAIWEADKYTIKYEKEEGAEEIEQVTDKPIKLPEEEPKKPGHSFVGWTPDPEAVEAYPELDEKTLLDLIKDYPELFEDEIIFHPVFEKNPDPEVTVKVENVTDPESEKVQVYDELKYTVTAKNKEEETRWEDITIRNKLPEGLTLIEDSIKLIDPEGKEIELKVEDVYNEKTRTIEVPIELIEGGKNYQLVYNVYVNGKSMKEQDIHNTIEVEGKNPDKSPTKTESETVLPEGGEKVELADPEPEIKVEVENKTRPTEEEAKVGDELEYQIEVKNTKKDSKWEGAIVEEKIPEGIEIISEYIEIEYPDGHREKIKVEEVYDKESRTLRIELGDIYGEEVYRIIYKARVEKEGIEIIDRPVKRPEKEENEADILGEDVKDKVKTEDEARVDVWLYMMGASMSLYITMILKGYKRRLEEQ